MRIRRFVPLQELGDRICLSLFFITLALVVYRHDWRDGYDHSKCDALLSHGQWLDAAHQNWQPRGCMMHDYNAKDLATCLQNRRLVFIGDSSTRQIFWATGKKLGLQDEGRDYHTSFSIGAIGVSIEFVWDPYLNSTDLRRELAAASVSMSGVTTVGTTAALLIGGGLWHARYLDEGSFLERFQHSIEVISESTSLYNARNAGGTIRRYGFGPLDKGSLVLLAPIPVPLYYALSPERAKTITPPKIDALNLYLYQQTDMRNVTVPWSFASMTALDATSYQTDGLHYRENVASQMADVLLNLRCNAVLRNASPKSYPMDKTCCNSYRKPNWTQVAILNAFLFLLPILALLASSNSKRLTFLPSRRISHAITVLALASCYCYYADRTQLFNKAQKHYNITELWILCAITLAIGILSIRRSANGSSLKSPHPSIQQVPAADYLSRHQTDEWKGWMQIIILIYHYFGASKVLWAYKVIRLLVASYIFLSGFGHTIYFQSKADYSLRRCAAVLIRLNLLSCILPYVMKTDYLFYYFAPLISFWYMVIYLTMSIGHSRNDSINYLLAKILISGVGINALIRTPGLFETLFYFLSKSCNIHWDVAEWRFRLQLDSYIVYAGMLWGLVFIELNDTFHSETPRSTVCGRFKMGNILSQFGFIENRIFSVVYAVATSLLYCFFVCTTPNKLVHNVVFPYLSWMPIVAFVNLRNLSRQMRSFHSSIFAWVGRHSLETFTLQFHIWLAADTKGLLALGVFEPMTGGVNGARRVDFVLLTIIFLWVSWHVAAATQTLTNWIVDPSEGREDVRIGEDVETGNEELSKVRSLEDVKEGYNQSRATNGITAGAMWSASLLKRFIAGDLRVRLALIVGVLWLLNVTYA